MTKKIYFFTNPPEYPTTRFRSQQYLSYFHQYGYTTIFCTSLASSIKKPQSESSISVLIFNIARYSTELKNVVNRWQQINQINDSDSIVYIHSFLTPFLETDYLAQVVRKKSLRMVLDMDDAIFATNRRTEIKLKKLLPLCDAVIVGNKYLAEFAHQYQKNTHIIPTPIETNYYVPKTDYDTQDEDKITVGWMGGWINLIHLNLIISSLKNLKSQISNIKIKIVTNIEDLPLNLRNIAELKQWSAEEELADLQSFDIGLMPLEDNPFSRGKCSFKLLQYMAVGIPVIASPVGMNNEVVRDNGFLCSSPEEWLDSLLLLCKNKQLRKKMGAKSRDIVESDYSTEINFIKLHRALTGDELNESKLD
ncbi:glycosyltransferase family 4 protein [Cyanobacterium aponinum AL20118]|uniref:Glycosyltransferase family 4 protein n=1 Tax=Cyanobacterium aponinum AL20115 TaxID=3090662 RepID=A0AAF0ZCA3_9CHRO|nr:glycosyltransferase family 4 protein [Cyanobacterium aponinum]WPF88364.1 glycosyltransferase family 4 protein [Cyanobacterium aponinum AL20115]